MLRTDLVCHPQSHLCRVQPAVISSAKITSKITYHDIVPRSMYPAVRVIASLELNKENVVCHINKFVLFLLTNHL